MTDFHPVKNMYDDEITFKELVLKIKSYIINFLQEWQIFLFVLIPLLTYFLYSHFTHVARFNAETKFVVEGGNSIGVGLGGILSQIGMRGNGSGKFNNYKILEIGKSKKILQKVIFEKHEGDYIANHLIKLYQLDKEWAKSNPQFDNFRFKTSDILKFSKTELAAYSSIINKVVGGNKIKDPILKIIYDQDSGIYTIYSSCRDESLTIKLANLNFTILKNFFEDELLESQIKTSSLLRFKSDSIQSLIKRKTSQISNIQNKSYGLVQATPNVNRAALEKEIMALTTAQAEFIKSYEMADVGLSEIRASFILIDDTIGPLEPKESSLLLSIIKGVGIASLISFLIASMKKMYKES